MSETSRRQFLQTGAAAAATMALPSLAMTNNHARKNVLFIGVDDLNTSLGCYGNTVVRTPNLDRLAGRGVRFDAAYCQYPLCSPSRSSLMTGMAPDTTRIYDLQTHFRRTLPDAVTIGQLFRNNGYYSARVGKIFHADNPREIGTDGLDDPVTWDWVYDPCGIDHLKEEALVTSFTPERKALGSSICFYPSRAEDREITDGVGAAEVIRLLKEHSHEPFFIAYGLYRPHVPWIVPEPYFAEYPLEEIQATPFDPSELNLAPPIAYWTQPPNFGMNETQRRKAIQAYYAATSFMDAQVGKVLDALDELHLANSTVVVFWSDHGWQLGQHGQWMKHNLFEASTKVPIIFAGPGVTPGQTCRRTVEHLDIYPTLVELCGLNGASENLHGESLARLLAQPHAEWSKPAVTQVEHILAGQPPVMGYSVRTEQHRYTSWKDGALGEELYDYRRDPHELNNLASDPSLHTLKFSLQVQLHSIISSRGANTKLPAAG